MPYLLHLQENAWNCFMEHLYDVMPEGSEGQDGVFSFDRDDEEAPHTPWKIFWYPGLSCMKRLHTLESTLDKDQIRATFPFLKNLDTFFFGDRS